MMDQMNVKSSPHGENTLGVAYAYPQANGPLSLAEYLLTRGESQTYLLLRWRMNIPHAVDSFRYILEQIDGGGRVLAISEHECRMLPDTPVGETFVPDEGVAVLDRCVDIRVRITEVSSEGYVYRLRGNRYDVDYAAGTPWVYRKSRGKPDGLTPKKNLRVRSKRSVHGRFLWVGALVTTLLLVGLLIYTACGRGDKSMQRSADAGTVSAVMAVTAEPHRG